MRMRHAVHDSVYLLDTTDALHSVWERKVYKISKILCFTELLLVKFLK